MSTATTPACRSCCRSCGRHFASLAAFELHLTWPEDADPQGWAPRACLDPRDVDGLHLLDAPGICRAHAGLPADVKVWAAA